MYQIAPTHALRIPTIALGVSDSGHEIYCDNQTLNAAGDRYASMRVRVSSALRRVPNHCMRRLVARSSAPQAGDIVLVRVETIGKNTRLELSNGRSCTLHVGDVLAMVFGNRYATNQFEGYARSNDDACDMLSMGGLCGLVVSTHTAMREPTRLRVLGAVADAAGRPLRLDDFAMPAVAVANRPHITVVCGTTMDSGKTHAVVSIIRGLQSGRRSVAAIKLTGTSCCRDTWKMHDAGAAPVLDFVDGGYPSTYLCTLGQLMNLYELLRGHAAIDGVQHLVVEIADGLLQRETAALLGDQTFGDSVDTWILAAADPLAAAGGVAVMRKAGIEPLAVSGLITCSQLAMREAEAATGIRCVTSQALQQGALNDAISLQAALLESSPAEVLA